MTNRTRKNHNEYRQYAVNVPIGTCEFCEFTEDHQSVLDSNKYFWVVKNIFPYDVWDTAGVSRHLMVIPRRHVDSIAHFSETERKAYVDLLANYEKDGFSIYARAPTSKIKSVIHQHTHLIEVDNKVKRILFYVKKPRIMWSK